MSRSTSHKFYANMFSWPFFLGGVKYRRRIFWSCQLQKPFVLRVKSTMWKYSSSGRISKLNCFDCILLLVFPTSLDFWQNQLIWGSFVCVCVSNSDTNVSYTPWNFTIDTRTDTTYFNANFPKHHFDSFWVSMSVFGDVLKMSSLIHKWIMEAIRKKHNPK